MVQSNMTTEILDQENIQNEKWRRSIGPGPYETQSILQMKKFNFIVLGKRCQWNSHVKVKFSRLECQ